MSIERYYPNMKNIAKVACNVLENTKNVPRSVTAYFRLMGSESGKTSIHLGNACHGGLQNAQEHLTRFPKNDTPIVVSWTQYNLTRQISQETRIRYYDWLLNRSPWADVHIIKDPKYVERHGCAVRLDYPHPLVLGALIAFRHGYEKPKLVNVFLTLVEAGMKEDLAFLYCNCLYHNYDYDNFIFGEVEYMHMSVYPYYDQTAVLKFLTHDLSSTEPTYIEAGFYSRINSFWGMPGDVQRELDRRNGNAPNALCLYDFHSAKEEHEKEKRLQSLNIFEEHRRARLHNGNGDNNTRVSNNLILKSEEVKEFAEFANIWFDSLGKKGVKINVKAA